MIHGVKVVRLSLSGGSGYISCNAKSEWDEGKGFGGVEVRDFTWDGGGWEVLGKC